MTSRCGLYIFVVRPYTKANERFFSNEPDRRPVDTALYQELVRVHPTEARLARLAALDARTPDTPLLDSCPPRVNAASRPEPNGIYGGGRRPD